jgi:dTDP-4-dehydrorhamnose 3,5-epimerase
MKVNESNLKGCFELQLEKFSDIRGEFVKTFHSPTITSFGLNDNYCEEYFSLSYKNVIRGMHFQIPPHDHIKLVNCIFGSVMDVVVDLRMDSPTYGQHAIFQLTSEKASMVYIPKGMAHGYCVLTEKAIMTYKVSTIYSKKCDSGIRWDSIGVNWPIDNPIISQRDSEFKSIQNYKSPF